MTIKIAETITELEGILALQQQNLKPNLTIEQQQKQGFVTVEHTLEQLQILNAVEPHIIAVDEGLVIAYALTMTAAAKKEIPLLVPMFEMFEKIKYQGKPLLASDYYVMGQICIHQNYTGKGVFRQLYDKHRAVFAPKFKYFLTEISTSNKRSIRAHEKVGFKTIHTFQDDIDEWNIVLLEMRH